MVVLPHDARHPEQINEPPESQPARRDPEQELDAPSIDVGVMQPEEDPKQVRESSGFLPLDILREKAILDLGREHR